jgi:hypothetical protein
LSLPGRLRLRRRDPDAGKDRDQTENQIERNRIGIADQLARHRRRGSAEAVGDDRDQDSG